MNRYPLWRYILLIVLIVFGVIYAVPSLYGEDPAIQVTSKSASPVTKQLTDTIKSNLAQHNISYKSAVLSDNTFLVRFDNTEDQLKAQDIIQAAAGSNYSVALNLAPRTPHWLTAIGADPVRLGLDLRGGIHFLLQVDVESLISRNQASDMQNMQQQLRQQRIRYASAVNQGKNGIYIRFRTAAARNQALSMIKKQFSNYVYTTEQKDGSYAIRAKLTEQAVMELNTYAMTQNLNILRNRVNELGVAEPSIQQQGKDKISVDLPGIQDTARAKDIIGTMATVELHLQDTEHDAAQAARTGIIPFGSKLYQYVVPETQATIPVLLKNQVVLKGSSIIGAHAAYDENGRPSVQVRVSSGEVGMFNRITRENIGKPLAVVYIENKTIKKLVNGKVVTTTKPFEKVINIATIQSALGTNFQITGLSSMQEAQKLALLLRSGAYSAKMSFVQESVVGPSLGKDNIHKGMVSILVGGILIFIFMAFYYRVFGLIADVALLLNVVFIVAVLAMLHATLTLPGMAAIVLTMGMAVDANVLINERIREELRNGMSPQASIYAGYERAFATIVDANVTTLIVAVVLLALGSGPVKGFAVTLIIGLLTSMITAIFFTRAIVNLTYGRREQLRRLSIGIRMPSQQKATN